MPTPAPAVTAALAQALAWHQAGRLDEAEAAYQCILDMAPEHADALHYLGVLAWQRERLPQADALLVRARRANPASAEACANHAGVLRQMGRGDDALAACEQSLARNPDVAATHFLRGSLLVAAGRLADAVASFDRALVLAPGDVEAHNERGGALMQLGRYGDALASYNAVVALAPDAAAARHNRATALRALGRATDALSDLDAALARTPRVGVLHCSRGAVLNDLRRFDEAIAAFDAALAHDPALAEAYCGRGAALAECNRDAEALASCEAALEIHPNLADAWSNRGLALSKLGRTEEALASYAQALQIRPDLSAALNNRAGCLAHAHRYHEAAQAYAAALAAAPALPYAAGMLLHCRMHGCAWDGLSAAVDALRADTRLGGRSAVPFVLLTIADVPAEQLACARLWADDHAVAPLPGVAREARAHHERIRVAYVSSDLQEHATAFLAAGLFEQHDRDRFEVTAISYGPVIADPMRERIVRGVEHFVDVRTLGDREVAQLMRTREIDIAVDLKGYTTDARTGILALRPAPIQVNFLGYPGTMGAPFIDYIVADDVVVPRDAQDGYVEHVVYLPGSYQVNDRLRGIAQQDPARAELGLPDSGFVFCSFNASYKITPPVFAIWMRLLRAVEGSVLWLLDCNATATANLRREAKARGVAPSRLIFAPRLPLPRHLARHRCADLFIDTMPVNAHTTASDALWAGLPVLTCAGAAFAGRVGASLLHAVGLPELVTASPAAYEALALQLATDAPMLASFRARLARNRDTAALFDTDHFRRHLEAAYARMWQRWQAGDPLAGFTVPPLALPGLASSLATYNTGLSR